MNDYFSLKPNEPNTVQVLGEVAHISSSEFSNSTREKFSEHFLGVVFAGIYLPYIGFKEDVKFIGYEEAAKYQKSKSRECK